MVPRERYRAIGKTKETLTVMRLCEGLPREFSTYFRYIRQGGVAPQFPPPKKKKVLEILMQYFKPVFKCCGARAEASGAEII